MPSAASNEAAVELLIEGRSRPVGNMSVSRVLPVAQRRAVGPWVFLDHLGPVALAPGEGFDVPPHPHIGLSTVTYLFAGEVLHRDSLGLVQAITAGALNLMTAGRGVVHSERSDSAFRASGGTLHGAQLWLGLPLANELDEPSFSHHPADSLPAAEQPGASVRVLLGEAYGLRSPVLHPARPLLLELQLEAGALLELPYTPERALLAIDGEVAVGEQRCARDQLLVLRAGASVLVRAQVASRLLLLGGPALDGPRFIEWNFVSSSRERLEQARRDWRAGAFPTVPGDERERIPQP